MTRCSESLEGAGDDFAGVAACVFGAEDTAADPDACDEPTPDAGGGGFSAQPLASTLTHNIHARRFTKSYSRLRIRRQR